MTSFLRNVSWVLFGDFCFFRKKGREMVEEDFVTKTSNFVDNHLQAFRTGTLLLAGTGILIIVKRTYLFSWFRNASDIPKEFIKRGISLRGQVKAVSNNNTIEVLHIPIVRTSKFREFKESHDESSSDLLLLTVAGVEFRDGSNQWLNNNLLNSNIKFLPLGINQDSQISSIIHKKRGYFRRNICVNEELVRQGLAVTGNHDKTLEQNELFKNLFSRLFKAEANALKKHRGVWSQPTIMERILSMKITVPNVLMWGRKLSSLIPRRKKREGE